MPIYEYYCSKCRGRFRHLARRIDVPAPPCPHCGNEQVERLVSAPNVLHDATYHETQLRDGAAQVDREDDQEVATYLKESGRLEDATGLYGSKAYRELISRRAEGATDSDLADLVDDLVAAADASPAAQMAAAAALSEQVENRIGAEGPPDDHEHEHVSGPSQDDDAPPAKRHDSRRSAPDLGWG
ncbi:MAG: FmdB family zinc ribbon protein [Anaerolineae bacterium]